MAAVAHVSVAEDELLRRSDELKKAVSDANTRDKIPAFDRSALDTQEWRPVVLECMELLVWRLLDEHGEVLDEGPDCPAPELDFPRTRCWPTSDRRTTSCANKVL